jgi:hypothetical protein
MTLNNRVEAALDVSGIPRAGEQQRGWLAESGRTTVRLYWGYGEPVIKNGTAHSYLAQCSQVLIQAGFHLGDSPKGDGAYVEVLA